MLFETVTSSIKNSYDQARNLTKDILNVKRFYFKKFKEMEKKMQKIRIMLENFRIISLKENGGVSFNLKDYANNLSRFFSNLAGYYFKNFNVQKTTLESQLVKSSVKRFITNVKILF